MWALLTEAFNDWLRHRGGRLGAALAYYSIFSLGPLLLIVTSVAGLFFAADAVRGSITTQFRSLLGEAGSQALEAMLKGASVSSSGKLAAALGVILLLIAALGVVVQLKDALNTIWEVPDERQAGLWWYLRTYLISLAGVLGLGFLLAMSLVISTALTAFSTWIGGSAVETMFWQVMNFVVSLAVLAVLFAMLFKWFPDVHVAWSDVWPGALVTALLFNIGKLAIAWYIGTQGLESTYGAPASLVILLIWVYYAAQILLFGAELTHVYAQRHGARRATATARLNPGHGQQRAT
jgi:membrane protein